jgi:hypothetical protein
MGTIYAWKMAGPRGMSCRRRTVEMDVRSVWGKKKRGRKRKKRGKCDPLPARSYVFTNPVLGNLSKKKFICLPITSLSTCYNHFYKSCFKGTLGDALRFQSKGCPYMHLLLFIDISDTLIIF